MKVAKGIKDQGVIVGNNFDKYSSRNPIVKWLMSGFDQSLSQLTQIADPVSIHEAGCGEGFWVLEWHKHGFQARGSDFSETVIEIARGNAKDVGVAQDLFKAKSVYDLVPEDDQADLLVCCEVLEHLEDPELALSVLQRVVKKHLIVSVPREPLWCAMNMARGKYLSNLGNTPGHIQHWSKRGFIDLVSKYFDVVEVKSPIPWTMLLCRSRDL